MPTRFKRAREGASKWWWFATIQFGELSIAKSGEGEEGVEDWVKDTKLNAIRIIAL